MSNADQGVAPKNGAAVVSGHTAVKNNPPKVIAKYHRGQSALQN